MATKTQAPVAVPQKPPKAKHVRVLLPSDGMSRWRDFENFVPFSREKFRQLVRAGKAPQPVKFSERCTAYPNRELHRFFADPLTYSVAVK